MKLILLLVLINSLLVINLSWCSATIDLSNVDLNKFQYFKNFPSAGLSKEGLLQPVVEKVQKAKAVIGYFKNVLLGNPAHEAESIIEFDPHHGDLYHPHYEHHYGPGGAHLIEALGHGHHPEHLEHYDVIPTHHHDHHDHDHLHAINDVIHPYPHHYDDHLETHSHLHHYDVIPPHHHHYYHQHIYD